LAVLDKLSLRPDEVLYVGSHRGPDATLVRGKYPYRGIFTGKFRRYGGSSQFNPLLLLRNVGDLFLILLGLVQSIWVMRRFNPDVVFCNGGFTSVPVALAAKLWRRPIVIQEADQTFGIANRILERLATRIAVAYPPQRPDPRIEVTGNPIREDILSATAASEIQGKSFDSTVPVVLVMGGTRGASRINHAIFAALVQLLTRCQVVHSVGAEDWAEAAGYRERLETSLRERYFPTKFLSEDYPQLLKRADLIVTRAGAGSLWESAALAKPMIVIPITRSANNHQMVNARHFSDKKGAVLLRESDLDGGQLTNQVEILLKDPRSATRMGEEAHALINLDGAERLATLITHTAHAPK
jgi:UDP-N-acetylglucosamine--N-acetylmuramyl-(pentapeptide) pyrophosphoryl-undecaprenol N-acetylglucosamine transferase